MASAGTLWINIAARTDKLTKGLNSARASLNKFGKIAIGGGLAAAAGAAALATRTFNEMAPKIDAVGKAAGRLGLSTQSLSALGFAAKMSGASVEQMTQSLTFMERNLAEAIKGAGPAADTLNAIGLNARELAGMNADDAFTAIADAISKLPSAAQKTQAAMNLFGRSGANLLPLMKDGAKGVRELMADADRLGVTFTGAQSKMVQAANDALTRITAATDGIKTQFTIAVAPAIEVAANKMADWVASINAGGAAGNKFSGAMQTLGKVVGVVADVAHVVHIAFLKLEQGISFVFAKVARTIAVTVSGAIRALNKLPAVKIGQVDFLNEAADSLDKQTAALGQKAWDKFIGPAPSEQINKFFEQVEKKADMAAKAIEPKMKNALLPPAIQGAFEAIGAKLGGLSNKSAAAAQKAAAGLAGIVSGKGLGPTPALALARSGSADAYRQQAAIRRQGDLDKVPKKHLAETKKHTTLLSDIAATLKSGGGVGLSNIFGKG